MNIDFNVGAVITIVFGEYDKRSEGNIGIGRGPSKLLFLICVKRGMGKLSAPVISLYVVRGKPQP